MILRLLLLALLAVGVPAAQAFAAQQAGTPQPGGPKGAGFAEWQETLGAVEAAVERGGLNNRVWALLGAQVERVKQEAAQAIAIAHARSGALAEQMKALGNNSTPEKQAEIDTALKAVKAGEFRARATLNRAAAIAEAGSRQLVAPIRRGKATPPPRSEPDEEAFPDSFRRWQDALDQINAALRKEGLTATSRALYRRVLDALFKEALAVRDKEIEAAGAVRRQHDALGPAPKEGEPAESADVAGERERLGALLAERDGQAKQANVVVVRTEELLERLRKAQQIRLWDELSQKAPIPVLPAAWAAAVPEFLKIMAVFLTAPIEWVRSDVAGDHWLQALPYLLGAILTSFLVGWPVRLWLLRRFGRDAANPNPSYARRLLAALVEGVGRGLLPSLAAIVVVVVMVSMGLLKGRFGDLVVIVVTNVVLFVIVAALTRASLAPRRPAWRLSRFTDDSARMLTHRMTAMAAMFAITNTLVAPTEFVPVSDTLDSVFTFIFASLNAFFVVALLRPQVWQQQAETRAGGDDEHNQLWPHLRLLCSILVVAAPLVGAFGYANFTRYLLINLILTGAVVAGCILLRSLIQDVAVLILGGQSHQDDDDEGGIKRLIDMSEQASGSLRLLINLFFDILLFFGMVVLILTIWGVPPEDISHWLGNAMRGITIGSRTFSITDLFFGLAVFLIIMMVARAIQWMLGERILPQTRLDRGVRDSIRSAVGYIGLFIAAASAISTIGLDLSSIALVAGALSVGIGFGLQNVVSNFVSGLILLAERPVKAGDWVVVGNNEGFIKRINVRATEMDTVHRASVIIPNAELLSTAVTNWTHRDSVGRIDIKVGVSYDSDPEQIRGILMQVAEEHPEVVADPPPAVLFMDFGSSSLDFELRVFLRRIHQRFRVGSEIRFAIFKAFKEAGVEIPFPQRVLHFPGGLGGPAAAEPVVEEPGMGAAEGGKPETGGGGN